MSKFIRIPIQSSLITSVAHDDFSNVLEIVFREGGIYEYADFSEKKFRKFLGSRSIGKFFNDKIRKNHRYRKVRF